MSRIKRVIRQDEEGTTAEVEVPRSGLFKITIPGKKHFAPGKSVQVRIAGTGRNMIVQYAG